MTTKITGSNIDSIANTGVKWNAVTVADGSTKLSASAGNGYFLDTNLGVIEVQFPASPTRGDTIILADYSGTFGTNKVIVDVQGQLLDSTAGQYFSLTANNTVASFVYIDSNKGWLAYKNSGVTSPSSALEAGGVLFSVAPQYTAATGGTVTTSDNFKIHTFTGDSNFVVSQVGNDSGGGNQVDYLVVAGGGAGGFDGGGGGGAGGFRVSNKYELPSPSTSPLASPTGITVTATSFPITVGAGAADKPSTGVSGNGSNSVFSTITSTGGGGGSPGGPACRPAGNGGSGGGTDRSGSSAPHVGSGNTPPVSPPQGNDGQYNPSAVGGGGGGAGGVGVRDCNGNGGVGSFVSPSLAVSCAGSTGPVSSTRYFAGGGAGGHNPSAVPCATQTGGSGGGGGVGVAGTANTGGGGGAGDAAGPVPQTGKAGGKGIVIIRYKYQTS